MPSSRASTAGFRDELLTEGLFPSLARARAKLAAWLTDCNIQRPHSQIGSLTSAEFAVAKHPVDATAIGHCACGELRAMVVTSTAYTGSTHG